MPWTQVGAVQQRLEHLGLEPDAVGQAGRHGGLDEAVLRCEALGRLDHADGAAGMDQKQCAHPRLLPEWLVAGTVVGGVGIGNRPPQGRDRQGAADLTAI